MALNFFILLVFYFFIRGFQDKSNKGISYCLSYACMGIGFMIKGPPAIIIPTLVIGCYILISRNWEELFQLRLRYGVAILAAIILPWFAIMLNIHGDEFKNHILGAELRDRIIHDTPFSLYYFGVIIRYYLPWSFFFMAALVIKLGLTSISPLSATLNKIYFSSLPEKLTTWHIKITQKNNQAFLFSILWIICPLTLFTLFRIEHSRYMLPVSIPIVMITAQFLSQLLDSPRTFQDRAFKIPYYLTLIFYLLIITLTALGIFLLLPHSPVPTGLTILLTLEIFGLVTLFVFHKLKKYFPMIVTLSITQIIILTALSGNALSYFNRYPMKLFANKILSDSQNNKHIGLYQLGNHRARMGVMTGLPAIYLKNPDELNLFIKSNETVYIVMRQSEWQENFHDSLVSAEGVDTGWKKSSITKVRIQSLLMRGLTSQLDEYSESYILLKKTNKK
jgi:4-amino-4-deoxy-L-arabinose transferase-like glycosyltransferase